MVLLKFRLLLIHNLKKVIGYINIFILVINNRLIMLIYLFFIKIINIYIKNVVFILIIISIIFIYFIKINLILLLIN